MQGRCACGDVQFEVTASPLIVHCCHCTYCQRETGSAFALNYYVEAVHVRINQGETEAIDTPSASGKGQIIHRCPTCHVALWSHYGGAGPDFAFVRVGVLKECAEIVPDVHIFTSTKLPWVTLPHAAQVFENYYHPKEVWSAEAQARFKAVRARRREP